MTEIVVNRQYGGFSLSDDAVYELIKMNSPLIEKLSYKEYFSSIPKRTAEEMAQEELNKDYGYGKIWVPYKKTGLLHNRMYSGVLIDPKEKIVYNDNSRNDENRSHPDLIKVVKQLGKRANGEHAILEIVTIPEEIKWTIEKYDGNEWVSEVHRTW